MVQIQNETTTVVLSVLSLLRKAVNEPIVFHDATILSTMIRARNTRTRRKFVLNKAVVPGVQCRLQYAAS